MVQLRLLVPKIHSGGHFSASLAHNDVIPAHCPPIHTYLQLCESNFFFFSFSFDFLFSLFYVFCSKEFFYSLILYSVIISLMCVQKQIYFKIISRGNIPRKLSDFYLFFCECGARSSLLADDSMGWKGLLPFYFQCKGLMAFNLSWKGPMSFSTTKG